MCGCNRAPVGGDGSQAADQVVTERAKLRQRQVDRHLDLVVTMETTGKVQMEVLIHDLELCLLFHLKHANTQSAVSTGANESEAPENRKREAKIGSQQTSRAGGSETSLPILRLQKCFLVS